MVFFLLSPIKLSAKYHPGITWREVTGNHFIVVFPKGYEAVGAYALQSAESMHQRLLELWGSHIRLQGKPRILLTDVNDNANGNATFFPFNQIEIFLFSPPPDSTLGSYQEWIPLVLSHELTHIYHFNSGSGVTYFLRRLLGSNPAFYPAVYMPVWVMEGAAVYGETVMNKWGRLNTPDFDLMLEQIYKHGKMPDWGDFWGQPSRWPGGTSYYLYGAFFLQFLADNYGPDKLKEFIRLFTRYPLPIRFSRGPIPLTLHNRFTQVFNKDINQLWAEFTTLLAHRYASAPTADPITPRTGVQIEKYPVFLDQHHIAYVNETYKTYPGIYLMNLQTGKRRRLLKKQGITSLHYSPSRQKLYFAAPEVYKTYYNYSDLYSLDPKTGRVKRLSRGSRLSYPVKSNNEEDPYIYCIKRKQTRSYLCRFHPETKQEDILGDKLGDILGDKLSDGYQSLAFLSLSPDGRQLAASVKQEGKNWQIGLFSLEGKHPRFITSGEARSYYPQWSQTGDLYFITQHNDRYLLAAHHPDQTDSTGNTVIHGNKTDTPPSLRSFALNGPHLLGSYFAPNGLQLALSPITPLSPSTPTDHIIPIPPSTPENRSTPITPKIPSRSYTPLRDLLPKYISPTYRDAGDEIQPGLLITGIDLTRRHSYSMEGFYGLSSRTGNYRVSYTYDGLHPSLTLSYSDLSTYYGNSGSISDLLHSEKKLNLSALYPLRITTKSQTYLYGNSHAESITVQSAQQAPTSRLQLNGVKLGIFYNTSKHYWDSISAADGIHLSLSYSREFKFMGSDYTINTVALQYKQYTALGRPNTLAFRFSSSGAWGEARRYVYMGGSESADSFHVAGNDLFDLMRGYPAGYFYGTGGWLVNLEYRISLLKIENVFFVVRSLEKLYLTLFADMGNLWQQKVVVDPAYSIGTELNLSLFIGDLKWNIACGIAKAFHPNHTAKIYLRLGRAF